MSTEDQSKPVERVTDERKVAERMLMNEFKEIQKEKWVQAEPRDGNIFLWDVALIVTNPQSLYYGAYLKAELKMPKNYPMLPPEFRFIRPLFHPNIYKDGRLCISILHRPGHDEMSGELASERWSPAQRIFTVLISILSLLDDAEVSSAANVDASIMLRKDPAAYKKRVQENVEASKRDIPEGFVMPDSAEDKSSRSQEDDNDDSFWNESSADESFGLDSDVDQMSEDDEEEGEAEEGE